MELIDLLEYAFVDVRHAYRNLIDKLKGRKYYIIEYRSGDRWMKKLRISTDRDMIYGEPKELDDCLIDFRKFVILLKIFCM